MTFEWIGAATLLAGGLSLLYGRHLAVVLLLVSTLLGAAAASVLTVLGSANLSPAHLLLGFVVLVAASGEHRRHALAAFVPPRPGAWLLLTLCYAVVLMLLMPRIMAGQTDVFGISRGDSGVDELTLTPLAPSSGNLTQTLYFIGDVACYAAFFAFARDHAGKRRVADAILLCAALNLGFALLDYITFFTGTGDYLGFMRNATYRIFDTAEVIGIKRLIGSFPEASAFASMTLALFAFTATLWLNGYRTMLSGPLCVLQAIALLLSTSTTAYVTLAIYLALLFCASVWRALRGRAGPIRLRALVVVPVAGGLIIALVMLHDGLSSAIYDMLDGLVFQKGSTDSALERGSWNLQALVNFIDSFGVGLGVGSVRASSSIVASLAALGVFGTLTYGLFIMGCIRAAGLDGHRESLAIREAAASACLALLIGGSISGTTIDLGLIFFACAGLASSPATLPSARRLMTDGRPSALRHAAPADLQEANGPGAPA